MQVMVQLVPRALELVELKKILLVSKIFSWFNLK
jgi:hypothetical protein